MVELLTVVLLLVVLSVPLALSVWALLDAAHRPAWVWAMSGRERTVWMALILFGTLVTPLGIVISSIYLIRVRAQLIRLESGDFDPLDDT